MSSSAWVRETVVLRALTNARGTQRLAICDNSPCGDSEVAGVPMIAQLQPVGSCDVLEAKRGQFVVLGVGGRVSLNMHDNRESHQRQAASANAYDESVLWRLWKMYSWMMTGQDKERADSQVTRWTHAPTALRLAQTAGAVPKA